MYLTNLGTRIWSPSIHTYSEKWFFGPQNSVVPLEHKEKTFFYTLNLMILKTVWNECVRFGEHVNIQVSYKILQLEVLKKALILYNPTCFQDRLFWSNFGLKCLGVKKVQVSIYIPILDPWSIFPKPKIICLHYVF